MTDMPSLATTVAFDPVSTVAVVDLEAACELYGRDMLPYPLGRSRPVGSVWLATRDVGLIDDRLNGGDLHGVRAWVEALVRADICVGCRVSFLGDDTPDLRLHALRADESGFFAVQRRDRDGVDAVDIYEVSPQDLGEVVADSVGLVGAGSEVCVAVTGCGDRLPAPAELHDEYDDFGFLIPPAEPRDPALRIVDGRDVVSIGTVQSWRDGDANHRFLQWVQVADDGDYLYAAGDAGYAEPLDTESLRACIESVIR